jgi:hypothetical protein
MRQRKVALSMEKFAARIHVLLARDAEVGVVLRRGPSKCVASILWDRKQDQFKVGQWLKGRIYERRCDLSPNGKHLLYFAMNGKWSSQARGSWTAISRAPFLKALALFAKGDCWHGGGLWTGDGTYWLNDGYGHEVLKDTSSLRRDKAYVPSPNYGGECTGVYYHRLIRDGWRLTQSPPGVESACDAFEKLIGKGWRLHKFAHADVDHPKGKGCYWDVHMLTNPDTGSSISCPTWDWADLDNNRLVWAAQGKLFAAKIMWIDP